MGQIRELKVRPRFLQDADKVTLPKRAEPIQLVAFSRVVQAAISAGVIGLILGLVIGRVFP